MRGSTPTPYLLLPGKARRLKQAKEEAQMEVEHYRREREQEFQSKQQAVRCGRVEMGSWGASWWVHLMRCVWGDPRRKQDGKGLKGTLGRDHVIVQGM